jgi:hypothetical protein
VDQATDVLPRTVVPVVDGVLHPLAQLPGCDAAVVADSFDGSTCRVRVTSGASFLRFALAQQGYGEIVREECL